MNWYTELKFDTHQRVVYCENDEVGLKAFIAIHNTKLGPSLGGCRMWNYDTKDDAIFDVLRLSKGMTYKNALADLDLGGGKSVIWGDAKTQKTPELLKAMGEFVEHIGGDYLIAEDVGICVNDVVTMREITKFTADPIGGDPGPWTAKGVHIGMKAISEIMSGSGDLTGLRIAVQGIGSVGLALVKLLRNDGAFVYASDINESNLMKAVELGAVPIHDEDIYSTVCEIFAPCALGAILNDQTILKLRCDAVAGSANNQLLEEYHGQMLLNEEILYAPDYVINAGGVILVSGENGANGFDHSIVEQKVNNIGHTLLKIITESYETGTATNVIADRMAEEIFRN